MTHSYGKLDSHAVTLYLLVVAWLIYDLNPTYLHVVRLTKNLRSVLLQSDISTAGGRRDANLCGACARPTDERSVVTGGEGDQRWCGGVFKEVTPKAIMHACQEDRRVR